MDYLNPEVKAHILDVLVKPRYGGQLDGLHQK